MNSPVKFFAKRVDMPNGIPKGDPRIWPPGELCVKASDFDALQAENEALAAGLRGKHELTGATYTHLVVQRDGLREEVTSLRAILDQARALLGRFNHAVRNCCSAATYKPIAVDAQAFLDATVTPCDKPPAGWTCSRDKGHAGPCAASQVFAGIPVVLDETLEPNEIRVVQGARCNRTIANGRPMPKSCAKCGLGPCNTFLGGADRKLPMHCQQPQAHPARCGCEGAQ